MSEWWTYTPSDLLLFSPRVYYRLIELHNIAVWPVHIGAALLGLLLVRFIAKPGRGSDRLVTVSLGAIWVWVAWSILWHRYAQINWAATYLAPVYALEGLLFIWVGCARGGLSFAPKRTPPSAAGLAPPAHGSHRLPPDRPRRWPPLACRRAVRGGAGPDRSDDARHSGAVVGERSDAADGHSCLWCFIAGATLWTMGSPTSLRRPLIALAAILFRSRGTGRCLGIPAVCE